jgi:hypothetical protein
LKELQEAVGSRLEQIDKWYDFLNRTQKSQPFKKSNEQMGLHQTKALLQSKGNSYQTQETAHRMGENLWQLLIQ